MSGTSQPLPSPTGAECCTPSGHPPSCGSTLRPERFVTVPHSPPFTCYVAQPPGGAPARGVILVVHDIFGPRSGRHARICDELAAAGFVAACPDLIGDADERASALNPGWPSSKAHEVGIVCHLVYRIRWMLKAAAAGKRMDEIGRKLAATLHYCRGAHPHAIAACGAVGFCWGGGVVARLLSEAGAERLPVPLVGGVGFHPSHRGWEAADVARPLLLAPAGDPHPIPRRSATFCDPSHLARAGDDPAAVQPGGALAQPLADRFGGACAAVRLFRGATRAGGLRRHGSRCENRCPSPRCCTGG